MARLEQTRPDTFIEKLKNNCKINYSKNRAFKSHIEFHSRRHIFVYTFLNHPKSILWANKL